MRFTIASLVLLAVAVPSFGAVILVPDGYATIQEAVDAAANGDTVSVHSGQYFEHVTITNSIALIGAGKEECTIDAEGIQSAVVVEASSVVIKGFTLANGGTVWEDAGIEVQDVSGLTISGNILSGSQRNGVYGYGLSNSVISGNLVVNNGAVGIYLVADADDNLVQSNNVRDNGYGMYIHVSSGNTIEENTFVSNDCGIKIISDSRETIVRSNVFSSNDRAILEASGEVNEIYHNNFVDTPPKAYDNSGYSSWDDGVARGNYWQDYTTRYPSATNDGYVWDTPYEIGGRKNQDNYPLVSYAVTPLLTYANGPYYGLVDQTVQFVGSVVGDSGPYEWFWDFGDGTTSEEMSPTHMYTTADEYTPVVSVTDTAGHVAIDSTIAIIKASNVAPEIPLPPAGPDVCEFACSYSAVVYDVDGDELFCQWDWGDGTITGWIGPLASGDSTTQSHTWRDSGDFDIRVRAMDHWDVGQWSDPLTVTAEALPCGDANASGEIDIDDIVYMIAYIFTGGPPPYPEWCLGDADGSGAVDIDDVVFLLNYIFSGGEAPGVECCL